MTENKGRINLSGAMDHIKRSKDPLIPIYEAMTNALESLSQRGSNKEELGQIDITLYFTGLIDCNELEQIDISDNGVGFTDENYNRFVEFFDRSKGYDNRGTGRLQYFHRFEKLRVLSYFRKSGKSFKRKIDCDKSRFIESQVFEETDGNHKLDTTVSLLNYYTDDQDKNFFKELTLDSLVQSITNKFLLRFYLDNVKNEYQAPRVKVSFVKGDSVDVRFIDPQEIISPKLQGKISVPYMKFLGPEKNKLEAVSGKSEVIKWAKFVLPEDQLDQNAIYLCSKDIPVLPLRFEGMKKNDSINGERYLTLFYGDVLDNPSNVSDSVDSFKFPRKKEIENRPNDIFFDPDEEFLLIDTIENEIDKVITNIYKDVALALSNQKHEVKKIADAHGIPSSIISLAKININDDEKTITKKLYQAQSILLAEKGYKAKHLFESLKSLDPTSPNYQDQIEKKSAALSSLVEEQNKEELSRYVIRREMIVEMLKSIVNNNLEYQSKPKQKGKNKDPEGLIHDLIIKRKSKDTNSLNDLWILNEEFIH